MENKEGGLLFRENKETFRLMVTVTDLRLAAVKDQITSSKNLQTACYTD